MIHRTHSKTHIQPLLRCIEIWKPLINIVPSLDYWVYKFWNYGRFDVQTEKKNWTTCETHVILRKVFPCRKLGSWPLACLISLVKKFGILGTLSASSLFFLEAVLSPRPLLSSFYRLQFSVSSAPVSPPHLPLELTSDTMCSDFYF